MNCPHCGIAFHDSWHPSVLLNAREGKEEQWYGKMMTCPSCHEAIIHLTRWLPVPGSKAKEFRVHPQNTFRKPTPQEVPLHIKEDYEDASKILSISPKASAALSRGCLQAILREQGYNQRDLAQQIDKLLNEPDPMKAIPTGLRQTVDAIRNFGNFSAHPVTDQTTLQVIEVDDGEAEWCLDILEEMFDHYYVKPQQAARRKAALDAKLAAAGKPRSK